MRASSGRDNRHISGAVERSPRRPLYKHWAFWASFLLLAIFPAISVNSASLEARLGWVVTFSMLFVFLLALIERARKDEEMHASGHYRHRGRPIAGAVFVAAPVLALIFSVAATHAVPEDPALWQMTIFMANLGDTIFPVVGKFVTQISPPLAPVTLYKAQSIVTLFLLAGLAMSIAMVPMMLSMPREERRAIREAGERYGRKIRSPAMRWLCMALAAVFGLAVFMGWIGFPLEPIHMSGKRCLVIAACYVQNDLLLLVAAFFITFMSFGIWMGALSMLRDAIAGDN